MSREGSEYVGLSKELWLGMKILCMVTDYIFLAKGDFKDKSKRKFGTSLVVQWLRIHIAIQGMQIKSPGWGNKIPHTTAQLNPMYHSYWACAPQILRQCAATKTHTQCSQINIFKKRKKKNWNWNLPASIIQPCLTWPDLFFLMCILISDIFSESLYMFHFWVLPLLQHFYQ